jgi:hypothetical protein
MAAWLFTAAAWMLLLAGVFVAWRFGWRDPGKGTLRCPKCWYDMSATSGLKCSECGREVTLEKRLRRRRVRRRWIVAGVVIALASWVPFKWPEYQRLSVLRSGVLAFVPRTVLVLGWPWIVDWQHASTDNPNAWWAKRNARMHYNVQAAIEPDSLWSWQRWLLLSGARAILRDTDSKARFMSAQEIMFRRASPDDETIAAYLDGYLQAPVSWQLQLMTDPVSPFEIPASYRDRLATYLVRNPRALRHDPLLFTSLRSAKVPMDEPLLAFLASAPSDTTLTRVAPYLVSPDMSSDAASALFARIQSAAQFDPVVIAQLVRSSPRTAGNFRSAIDRAMRDANPFIRGQIITALGLIPSGDSRIDEMLGSYRCDPHHEVEFAADLALATRAGDPEQLRLLVQQADHSIAEPQGERLGPSLRVLRASLIEFASRGTWPMPLRLEALWLVIESVTNSASEVDGRLAVNAVIRLGDGYRPEAVNFFAQRFREQHRVGLWAWHAYLGSEYVPREMLSAARDSLGSLEGGVRAARVRQIAQAETKVR